MKPYFLTLFSFICFHLHAQDLLGKDRENILKKMEDQFANSKLAGSTDSTMTFSLNADNPSETTFTLYFSGDGKVSMEQLSSSCRNCYQAYLQKVLDKRKYRWKKLNGNQWVSKFSRQVLLERDPEGGSSFRIIPTSWTRASYRLLFD